MQTHLSLRRHNNCHLWNLTQCAYLSGNSSPPSSIEDAYYEDADNNYPTTRLNGASKNSCKKPVLFVMLVPIKMCYISFNMSWCQQTMIQMHSAVLMSPTMKRMRKLKAERGRTSGLQRRVQMVKWKTAANVLSCFARNASVNGLSS